MSSSPGGGRAGLNPYHRRRIRYEEAPGLPQSNWDMTVVGDHLTVIVISLYGGCCMVEYVHLKLVIWLGSTRQRSVFGPPP
jgi:hypothetical protein